MFGECRVRTHSTFRNFLSNRFLTLNNIECRVVATSILYILSLIPKPIIGFGLLRFLSD